MTPTLGLFVCIFWGWGVVSICFCLLWRCTPVTFCGIGASTPMLCGLIVELGLLWIPNEFLNLTRRDIKTFERYLVLLFVWRLPACLFLVMAHLTYPPVVTSRHTPSPVRHRGATGAAGVEEEEEEKQGEPSGSVPQAPKIRPTAHCGRVYRSIGRLS